MSQYRVRKTVNGTLRGRIADYIAEHPGCTSKDIHAAHRAAAANAHPVSDALLYLVKERVIEEVYEPNGTRHLYLKGAAPTTSPVATMYRCPLCRLIAFFKGEKDV